MAEESSTSAPVPAAANVAAVSAAPVTTSVVPAAPISASETPAAAATSVSTETSVTTTTSPAIVAETPQATKIETVLGSEPKVAPAEPAKAEAAPEAPKSPEAKAPEAKKEEAAPAEGETKVESSQTEEAPLPQYEAFTLPEGITLDDKKLGEFTKKLGEIQNATKADQALMQKFGQEMVEAHIADTQEIASRLADHYSKAWDKQTNDWFEAFAKDPEIGDKKLETTTQRVLKAVGENAGSPEQLKEFKNVMTTTGIGNHPSVIRLINNMQSKIEAMREKYESEKGVKPLGNIKPVAEKKGFLQTMYGTMK